MGLSSQTLCATYPDYLALPWQSLVYFFWMILNTLASYMCPHTTSPAESVMEHCQVPKKTML